MVVLAKHSPVSYLVQHAVTPGPVRKIHVRDLKPWYRPKPKFRANMCQHGPDSKPTIGHQLRILLEETRRIDIERRRS